ncbi:hypothetical protein SAMN03159488_02054 [Pseudomonas sp. NFIX10]|uniref:hypothetical protein n=1 Tax=Pseudomonas TaxID=286 RepID=UPI0008E68D06|nr:MULTISPECIES: hypothetical protein [unclassified Pseudomonas]SFB13280.1 hypothetical protein SAMN03159488_02054 [Pseudomonas sp. NFIX10]SFE68443.1 hypothetical protein SAMN03159367_01847 [Pseudomonas sp. NFACC06-1]
MAKKSKAAVAQTAEPAKALAAKPKAPAKVTTAKKLSAAAKPKTPRGEAAASSKQMYNSHSDAAERMLQLAQFLSEDPEEAKVFAKKTGVYTKAGNLTATYR